MSNQSYEDASEADKIHFMGCVECGEKIDMRDLDEICQHEDHQPHPDIPYTGSARMEPHIFDGVDRTGYCAFCVHSMEYRDSTDPTTACDGCKGTEEKSNWKPQPKDWKP